MFKQLVSTLCPAIALAIVGCAKKPESIAPAYVSHIQYQAYNCAQLGSEAARIQQAYTVAAEQQSNARTNDTIGIIFLGLPVSSLSGDNIAPQIAQLKGQTKAVGEAARLKGCALPSVQVAKKAGNTSAE